MLQLLATLTCLAANRSLKRLAESTTRNDAIVSVVSGNGPQSAEFMADLRKYALRKLFWDSESYLGQSARRFGIGELCEDEIMNGGFSIGEDNYTSSEPFEYGLPKGEKLATMCAQAYRQIQQARGMRRQGYVDAFETEQAAQDWGGYVPQDIDDNGDETFAPTLGREDECDEHRHVCGVGMWDGEKPNTNIENDTLQDLRVEYAANKNNRPFLTRGKDSTIKGKPDKTAKNTRIDILAAIKADGKRIRDERIASVDANAIDRLSNGQKIVYHSGSCMPGYRPQNGTVISYDKRDDAYTISARGETINNVSRDSIIAVTDRGSDTTEYMRLGETQRAARFIDLRIIVATAALTREGVAWLKYRFDSLEDINTDSYKARGKAIGRSVKVKTASISSRQWPYCSKRALFARTTKVKRTNKGRPTGKSNPLAMGPSYWLTKSQMDMLKDMKDSVLSMRSYWGNLTINEAMSFERKMFPQSTNGNSVGTRKAIKNGMPVAMPFCMDSLSSDGEYVRADYFPLAQSTLRIDLEESNKTSRDDNQYRSLMTYLSTRITSVK